jgi:YHS domain-containing protein
MIQTIIALTAMAQIPALKCPVMGSAIASSSSIVEYNGSRFQFCCAGCDTNFAKSPESFLKTQREVKNTVGAFLFDPVSRLRLDFEKAKATVDFESIRYPFQTEENKRAFLANPRKFAAVPSKEALYCPVGKEAVTSYSKASDYVDHEGVRWYMCCAGCGGPFEKDPKKYLFPGIEENIQVPKALKQESSHQSPPSAEAKIVTKVKFGKYEAILRVPEEGLFAQEEVDVEFRVTDTTAKDPIEEGFKGVGGIETKAVVTMPSMEGMPEARPEVHREGVPGDYGIVLYFPHGGDYKIDLTLSIPGKGEEKIAFFVDVKDERPANASRPQPFRLDVVEWPTHAMAGTDLPLKMRVIDTKSNSTQTSFDIAHEKKFHLLIASKDLNWFLHEHPEMSPDGTWSVPIKFPAGGDYWIYGDVAPTGKGSRVLITKVTVHGDKPTWDTNLKLSNVAVDGGLKGELNTRDIQIGRMTTLMVKLTDAETGKPAGDTVKWLGAAGHMMIFHQDGLTVVHSHPAENEENEAQVKQGMVHFTGRFPKPGLYKVYAQFDWRGAVRTLGFAIEVKG